MVKKCDTAITRDTISAVSFGPWAEKAEKNASCVSHNPFITYMRAKRESESCRTFYVKQICANHILVPLPKKS